MLGLKCPACGCYVLFLKSGFHHVAPDVLELNLELHFVDQADLELIDSSVPSSASQALGLKRPAPPHLASSI